MSYTIEVGMTTGQWYWSVTRLGVSIDSGWTDSIEQAASEATRVMLVEHRQQ